MMSPMRLSSLKNQDGIITVDFLFSFVLVMGFTMILLTLALTLTVAEVTQYMTFAAARNLMAADMTPARQVQNAQAKFNSLRSLAPIAPMLSGSWFEIATAPEKMIVSPTIPAGQSAAVNSQAFQEMGQFTLLGDNLFVGVQVDFIARVLDFNIPFFGSTTTESDGNGSGFRTQIGSFLGREPSVYECQVVFNGQRYNQIVRLFPAGLSTKSTTSYLSISDNGC